ncbi:hypothetical protein [Kribbella deserti]|uniref:Uncharacterized protein n=1 Tax=Kribbella deserti TaxID=1926257 RepID=A0ABV6QFP4_9ACTN
MALTLLPMAPDAEMRYDDRPVMRVRVTASAQFEAYVFADNYAHGGWRIGTEIADAIEHRAPHLSASEDGDALIALVGGGSGHAVQVDADVEILTSNDTSHDVKHAIEATEAWL